MKTIVPLAIFLGVFWQCQDSQSKISTLQSSMPPVDTCTCPQLYQYHATAYAHSDSGQAEVTLPKIKAEVKMDPKNPISGEVQAGSAKFTKEKSARGSGNLVPNTALELSVAQSNYLCWMWISLCRQHWPPKGLEEFNKEVKNLLKPISPSTTPSAPRPKQQHGIVANGLTILDQSATGLRFTYGYSHAAPASLQILFRFREKGLGYWQNLRRSDLVYLLPSNNVFDFDVQKLGLGAAPDDIDFAVYLLMEGKEPVLVQDFTKSASAQ